MRASSQNLECLIKWCHPHYTQRPSLRNDELLPSSGILKRSIFSRPSGTSIELPFMSIRLQCLLAWVQLCECSSLNMEGELTSGGKSRIIEIHSCEIWPTQSLIDTNSFVDYHCKSLKFFVCYVMVYGKYFFSCCNILMAFSLLVFSRFYRSLKTPAQTNMSTRNRRILFISAFPWELMQKRMTVFFGSQWSYKIVIQ